MRNRRKQIDKDIERADGKANIGRNKQSVMETYRKRDRWRDKKTFSEIKIR